MRCYYFVTNSNNRSGTRREKAWPTVKDKRGQATKLLFLSLFCILLFALSFYMKSGKFSCIISTV